ncbi:ferredoxin [Geodermatophilus obscurus]|uniref:Ferredoxin n=1 Tax=Geodermatophilus obscurus TaxID=1861 RepID=A0A1M7TW83_9ACTN|nr:ferredoxin [Geodermatophilus obscurus]SHN74955.1 ferredoxin [Geodermatophilus obscurus]
MRIEADRDLCVGSGTCEFLAADVFQVGEDGVVRVLRPQPGQAAAAVRDAVAQCPTGALGLADW